MSFITKFLKCIRPRAIVIKSGPTILGGMNVQGVTGARLGLTDIILPFDTNYDLPLPFANTPFNTSPSILTSGAVWAFPLHGFNAGEGSGSYAVGLQQYRKPKYPKGA